MFAPGSRYANLPTYTVTDHRGRSVAVVPAAPPPLQRLRGIHCRKEGERLDHLAQLYLQDGTAFWRIAEENGVMLAESLSEAADIEIPVR
jgi:hypothetical protein